MGCIKLCLLFYLPLLVVSDTCNDQIHLNGRQQKSSIYCSSCSTYINGQISSPVLQLELPSLTRLTGIFIQKYFKDPAGHPNTGSYFIEYRRTQDGPWQAYGQRRQRKLFIERRRLFFNDDEKSNRTRTFLPSIIARQIRILFVTSSISTCAIVQVFGCPSRTGLISTRFSQRSILHTDFKYDGLITNSTARGGLGMLTDGDPNQFLQWSSSFEPILLLFAFDSIKQFQSINLDIKCSLSTICKIQINIGILEIVTSKKLWTNRFHSISIDNHQHSENTTITHLILSLSNTKGQFVVIQINRKDGLALSEVTFNNRNENDDDDDDDVLPSSIYIEANLRRLESFAWNSLPDQTPVNHKLFNFLIVLLITCALLVMFIVLSCMLKEKGLNDYKMTSEEIEESLTTSIVTNANDEHIQNQSEMDIYSSVESYDDDDRQSTAECAEPIKFPKIVNESAQATIRSLTSYRQSMTPQCSQTNVHLFDNHLLEIDSNEIIIIENLGAQSNHQCFASEYGKQKLSVILYEEEKNEFCNLSRVLDHSNIVSCFGYVHVSPERYLLVGEHSLVNLFEYCQSMSIEDQSTLITMMRFVDDIVSALLHLESLNIILRDLTLPNCLLFDNKTIKLSDYAKKDDRYASRYVQQLPIRWLPGDIVIGDETWSIHTNTFMFGTLLFEFFHLGLSSPYKDLHDNEVFQFYREFWSNSKQNSIEPSVLCFSQYFPRPSLCNDRLYALIERCLSWASLDRPSFREIRLCLDETTTSLLSQ